MDGEYWYEYIKEHKPDVLGKDIIDYVEQLKLDKESLEKQLRLHGVSQQRELLEAYTQFLWTQHNNLTNADNNKIALDKFIASNCG